MITKLLFSAAIALGSCVVTAAPALADSDPIGPDPNPFSALSCGCRETAPAYSPDVTDQINRGIQDALKN